MAASFLGVLLVLGIDYSVTDAEASMQKALSEEELCRAADVIIVGKVLERKSYHEPEALNAMVTEARLSVEATAHGIVGEEISLRVLGGRIGQERAITPGSPWFTIGARCLLFLHSLEHNGQQRYGIIRWMQVDSLADTPPSQVLADIWSEHCTPNIVGDTQGKPTEPYILLLPEWFFDWCKHYDEPSLHDTRDGRTPLPIQDLQPK